MTQEKWEKAPTRREKRREAILDAAREVFLQRGYGETSLNDIVSVSGGSLATLYDLFGGKAGLFTAMIEEECENFFGVLHSADIEERPLREALGLVARQFFDGVTQQPKTSLLRLIVAEVPNFPEIGVNFYEAGPARGRKMVSAYLESQARRGLLRIDDPARAADVFIDLVLSGYQMKMLCGIDMELTEEEIDKHLDYTLGVFLKIYGPEPAPG